MGRVWDGHGTGMGRVWDGYGTGMGEEWEGYERGMQLSNWPGHRQSSNCTSLNRNNDM